MKPFATFIILLIFSSQLFSQELTKEATIGNWKVVNSQMIPKMLKGSDAKVKSKMEQMRKGFIGTIFSFGVNNRFTIKFADNTPKFMKELEFLNNQQWIIQKGQRIAIGSEKDGYSLMGIIVRTLQGKKYFIIDECPFFLEVI